MPCFSRTELLFCDNEQDVLSLLFHTGRQPRKHFNLTVFLLFFLFVFFFWGGGGVKHQLKQNSVVS